MLNEMFYKYQSLGNDFVLIDWLDEKQKSIDEIINSDEWPDFISHLCSRNFGIGADGVLIVKKKSESQIEGVVFNSDGSNGETSLNGLRCIAHYLIKQKNYPANLNVFMGNKDMQCELQDDEIRIQVSNIIYKKEKTINVLNKNFLGHIVDVGNPHFIIFSDIDPVWLSENGIKISEHKFFPNRTNVEFVWEYSEAAKKQKVYCMLVYERGVGMTLACGSGAAAAVMALYKLNKIKTNKKVVIEMSGGTLISYIDDKNNVIQLASAEMVFKGSFLV